MRTLLILLLLSSSALAQDATSTLPEVATIVSELQARIAQLEAENRELAAKLHRFEEANQPTPAAKIVMESIDNCTACVVSDASDAPRYRRAGWLWETVKVRAAPGRTYPRYRVCIGDVCEVVEIRNLGELDGKIREVLERRK